MTNLDPRLTFGSLDLTDYPYGLEFGKDFGGPEMVYATLSSQLADGEIVSGYRTSNRTLTFTVVVDGADFVSLAEAEAALVAECDAAGNTLTFDPGDGIGAATVFDTFRASVRPLYNDDTDVALTKRFTLTIPALPYGRSVDKVTDSAAAAPSGSGSILYAAESTAGWSAYAGPATTAAVDSSIYHDGTGSVAVPAGTYGLTVDDPTLGASANAVSLDQVTGLSLSTSTGGYMSVLVRTDWTTSYPGFTSGLTGLKVNYGAGWVDTSFVASESYSDGFVRYVWPVAAGLTVTGLRFAVQQAQYGYASTVPKVRYDSVSLATSATTDNQIVKSIAVEGSVRAPGSIHVAAPSDSVALGNVLVATVHESEVMAGFRPDMRRWVTAGSTTVDASALGGSYYTPPASYGSSVQFEAPALIFCPGNYAVVMLVKLTASTPVTVGVETQLAFSSTATGSASSVDTVATASATGWALVPVGTVRIPAVSNPTSAAKIRIRPKGNIPMAELYLIPEAADFTIASCGTGTVSASAASSHLWVDSPDAANPMGAWWRGPSADQANRRRLSLVSELPRPGRHSFKPGNVLCWCLSTGASGPVVTLEHYPHWHSNAAK